MKFTSEDLMKAMGLAVGDRIKAPNGVIYEVVSEVVDYANVIGLINKGKYEDNYFPLKMLVCDEDFEILPKLKKVGELNCKEYRKERCNSCPIRVLCVDDCTNNTLYNKLELAHKYGKDQEIYDILKKRLDKEVEDNETKIK